MIPVILNLANCMMIVGAVAVAAKGAEDRKQVFRYFTVLSNLLCAAASAAEAIARMTGGASLGICLLKFTSTCAVTVTLLTVVFFLAPRLGGLLEMIRGINFFLHLLCPLIAILTWLVWDKVLPGGGRAGFSTLGFMPALLGVLPVLLYGALYMYKVLSAPEGRRWDDFYTFNRGGRWKISYAVMVLAALVIGVVLWGI